MMSEEILKLIDATHTSEQISVDLDFEILHPVHITYINIGQ